jgi:RimJ/RimL family protein N-acetyltransferase
MIVTDKTALIAFAEKHIAHGRWRYPERVASVGWEKHGRLVASVIFDHYQPPSISGHIASDGSKSWCSRDFLRAIFYYPFRQLTCVRMTAPMSANNAAARRFVEKLGFVLEGTLRKAWPDGSDEVVYGLLKEDCKWL